MFAIKKDRSGFRSINEENEVFPDEYFSGSPPDWTPSSVPNEAIKGQISALEATVTPRRLREAVLGVDGGWLAAINAQIDALRAQLQSQP